MHATEPLLRPTRISDLRPTQMMVGLREVEQKRHEWRDHVAKHGRDYLARHMVPVVIGPRQRPWMIDNHHLFRALHDEGVEEVLVHSIADRSMVPGRLFRTFLDNRNWLHPYDAKGHRQPVAQIPKHIGGLLDDPYRSLSGELRRRGGYAKDATPFSEFLWADFLRRHVGLHDVEHDFEAACEKALKLARHSKASYLPGWCGSAK